MRIGTMSWLDAIPKPLIIVVYVWLAIASLGLPFATLLSIEQSYFGLIVGCVPHWIHAALWAYLKEDLRWEGLANGACILRYACLFFGSAVSFIAFLTTAPEILLFALLAFVCCSAAFVFPQIVFKVKENSYPFHKPWIITAACGIAGTTVLSVVLHLLFP